MKKLLGAITLLAGLAASGSVWAACATTIPVEDSASTSHTMGSLSDASGNCLFETGLLTHSGGIADAVIGAATAPANGFAVLGVYKSAAPTLSTGQSFALLMDAAANLDVNVQVSALPALAATSTLQSTGNTALTTINTTLGSPMQASGGSVTANAGTNLNTSALATSANQITGSQPANNANFFDPTLTITASTSSTSFIGVSSGKYAYITSLSCFNSSATGTTISVQNGSGGTTIWEGYVPATFGFTTDFKTPIGGSVSMTVSTAVYLAAGTSVSSLYCNASGYYQ